MTLLTYIPRTLDLGPFAGPIFAIIFFVDALFFKFLEWHMPEFDVDKVCRHWDKSKLPE